MNIGVELVAALLPRFTFFAGAQRNGRLVAQITRIGKEADDTLSFVCCSHHASPGAIAGRCRGPPRCCIMVFLLNRGAEMSFTLIFSPLITAILDNADRLPGCLGGR